MDDQVGGLVADHNDPIHHSSLRLALPPLVEALSVPDLVLPVVAIANLTPGAVDVVVVHTLCTED